ncbi:acyl-CoA thioesterase [Acinetobacter junii]|uniref:acyl-CoA thioesterase n=1 Tax=Acinetobacter junii TaxID=40215 RepID=UPI003212B830
MSFKLEITPRFYETDAFGHINNTAITGWFEAAREPIFRIFAPVDVLDLPLILRRVEVDYVAQAYYGKTVQIHTAIESIKNSSFVVIQEAFQDNICIAYGKAVQVYFDFKTQKSLALPEYYRLQLSQIMKADQHE